MLDGHAAVAILNPKSLLKDLSGGISMKRYLAVLVTALLLPSYGAGQQFKPDTPPDYPTEQRTKTGINADSAIRRAEYLRIMEEVRRRRQENYERYLEHKRYLRDLHKDDMAKMSRPPASRALRATEPPIASSMWRRSSGEITWPVALRLDAFDAQRKEIESLLVRSGRGEYIYYEAKPELDEISLTLREISSVLHSRHRMDAQSFLKSLEQELLNGATGTTNSTIATDRAPEQQTLSPKNDTADGWQVLNGDWYTYHNKEFWQISGDGGLIRGTADKGISHLFHKGDFADFELSCDVKVGRTASSGLFFRAEDGSPSVNGKIKGYEFQIIGSGVVAQGRTGSLWNLAYEKENLISDDQWFAVHIIARGNRIVTKINDRVVVDYTDTQSQYRSGNIALQIWAMKDPTDVSFRNIRLRKL